MYESVPSRSELVEHLVHSRIAGNVATPRENNLDHYRQLAAGNRYYWLGLELDGDRWTYEATLAEMASRCGVSPDPEHGRGQDTIDPELTVAALERMAVRLRAAARRRERVFLATGHPTGLLPVHLAIGRALRRAGCELLAAPEGIVNLPSATKERWMGIFREEGEVRRIEHVAVLRAHGDLRHTHSAEFVHRVLDALAAQGSPGPDLVVADHGWAGGAGARGVDTVGFADCNDPALFLGEAQGDLLVTVPLDDNVPPHLYEPMTAYLLHAAGLPVD
ncbi:phosphatase [Allostreptomyces psammosilenae]|uniref:Phosphatase n=1 Tax=Allostreptomyces psammosilenae TaxID=1892865 RepID=A0A853A1Q5_9ACTN|nr:phosphatase [Allostreptomyces psammosilenae]NYI08309.1 hypothetical protein [Allostreptomyces psammosilenae]